MSQFAGTWFCLVCCKGFVEELKHTSGAACQGNVAPRNITAHQHVTNVLRELFAAVHIHVQEGITCLFADEVAILARSHKKRVEFYFLTCFFFFLWSLFFFGRGGGLGGGHPCNCRHFGTLGSSCNMKSVNSRRDRGGRRRHPCNCRYFWTLESSCYLKSVNSHRDRGGRRRHPCNCRYFWTLKSSCNYEKY